MALSGGGIITGVLTWKEIRSMEFSGNKRGWHYNGGALYTLSFTIIFYLDC